MEKDGQGLQLGTVLYAILRSKALYQYEIHFQETVSDWVKC